MAKQQHYLLVMNPCSGQQGCAALLQLRQRLQQKGLPYAVFETKADSRTTRQQLQEKLDNGISDVVVIGGDGTLHLLCNLLAYTDIRLGVVPCGTGNDFARHIYQQSDDVMAVVTGEHACCIDLGQCGSGYFINVLGVGYDAMIAEKNSGIERKRLRKLFYLWNALKYLPIYREQMLQLVSVQGQWRGEALMVAFGNGRFFGSGMHITPRAELEDGLLDCCRVGKLGFFRKLHALQKLFAGTHLEVEQIDYQQGSVFQISTPDLPVEADGEFIGYTPVEVRCAPKALWVKLPPR